MSKLNFSHLFTILHPKCHLFILDFSLIVSLFFMVRFVYLIEFMIEICLATITSNIYMYAHYSSFQKKDPEKNTHINFLYFFLFRFIEESLESCARVYRDSFYYFIHWRIINFSSLFFFFFQKITQNGCFF